MPAALDGGDAIGGSGIVPPALGGGGGIELKLFTEPNALKSDTVPPALGGGGILLKLLTEPAGDSGGGGCVIVLTALYSPLAFRRALCIS